MELWLTPAEKAQEPMDEDVARAIRQLPWLTIPALSVKYRELFNQTPRLAHKAFLVRRIAWQLQAQALGDLSERSHDRIAEIADHSDIRRGARPGLLSPAAAPREPLAPITGSISKRDPRLPPPAAFFSAGTRVGRLSSRS
jgi:DUF2924 family protein